jgi:hypothetical protein
MITALNHICKFASVVFAGVMLIALPGFYRNAEKIKGTVTAAYRFNSATVKK